MDEKIKYLVTFFNNISFVSKYSIDVVDEGFKQMIYGFIKSYYRDYEDLMDKIFDVSKEDDKYFIKVYFEEANEYAYLFKYFPQDFIKIYEDVGEEDVTEIMNLAILFWHYVYEINDLNSYKKVRR